MTDKEYLQLKTIAALHHVTERIRIVDSQFARDVADDVLLQFMRDSGYGEVVDAYLEARTELSFYLGEPDDER